MPQKNPGSDNRKMRQMDEREDMTILVLACHYSTLPPLFGNGLILCLLAMGGEADALLICTITAFGA